MFPFPFEDMATKARFGIENSVYATDISSEIHLGLFSYGSMN